MDTNWLLQSWLPVSDDDDGSHRQVIERDLSAKRPIYSEVLIYEHNPFKKSVNQIVCYVSNWYYI